MAREPMLLPQVEEVYGETTENIYLVIYYYNADMIRSIEPAKKEGQTVIRHLDGSSKTFLINPIDFYKLIVKLEGSINLNCIEECRAVDNFTVNKLTENLTMRKY